MMTNRKISGRKTRQGEAPGVVRYVLVLSTAAAFTALVVLFLVAL